MLREIEFINQEPGKYSRRWFTCETSDLYLWHDKNKKLVKFQFSFDKTSSEKIITWKSDTGFKYSDIVLDNHKINFQGGSPLLSKTQFRVKPDLKKKFKELSENIELEITEFILEKLQA